MNLELQIGLGMGAAVLGVAGYLLGLFQGMRDPAKWREFFLGLTASTTWRGIVCSMALPLSWTLLYYAFIAHIFLALGRWPKFGEQLEGHWINLHDEAIRYLYGALVVSLAPAAVVLLGCLPIRRLRHWSTYALCYGGAVGLASLAFFYLAPHPFLNWLFD